ncbi:MAG TPA: hypothetical protein VD867_17695 [Burkholderiales bacterium]|nr:hypothetical protein [Burkholderiales bacterium]
MVNASEKRRLLESYRKPVNARAAVARAAAGLLIVAIIAFIGERYSLDREGVREIRSQQAARGR